MEFIENKNNYIYFKSETFGNVKWVQIFIVNSSTNLNFRHYENKISGRKKDLNLDTWNVFYIIHHKKSRIDVVSNVRAVMWASRLSPVTSIPWKNKHRDTGKPIYYHSFAVSFNRRCSDLDKIVGNNTDCWTWLYDREIISTGIT